MPPSRPLLALLLLLLPACGGGDEERAEVDDTPSERRREAAAAADPRAEVYASADRRELGPALVQALEASDPLLRLAAVESLGRLRDPASFERLRRALRDPDARVRLAASFGLSLLELPAVEEALLAAVAAALADPRPDRVEEIAAHVRDLGRVGAGAALPALRAALDHDAAEVRLAATDALAGFGRRQVPVSDDLHLSLLRAVSHDATASVREGAARALGSLAPPIPAALQEEVRRGLVSALEGAESPALAAMIARALHAYPAVPTGLATRLAARPEPAVAYEALRLLARAGGAGEGALATALGQITDSVLLVDALPLAFPSARASAIHTVAQRIHRALGARREPTRADALAHCAAAELVDRGKGWPAKTADCGLGLVPADLGARRAAAILRDVPGEDALRAAFLTRLYRAGPASVQAAVLDALAGLPLEAARPLLLQGLASRDVAVLSAALRLVVHHRAGLLATQSGPSLFRPLAAARAALTAADDAPGLVLFAQAAAALPDPRHAVALRELSAHPHRAVREAARRGLAGFPGTEAAAAFPPPPNPIAASDLAARPAARTYRVRTTAGAFVVELDPDAAPVTTRRFQALAAAGFYDGLTFHARSPGFVVQGGDPRGDGYGGPGYSVRDEPSRSRFERGTVGLALAGPDTGGSQFFVTLADQPQLEGRYTAFGRVVSGLEVVDRLVPGDRLERLEALAD